jgi:hypothetical protein
MIPLMIQPLIAGGLNLLANAAMAKGKEWIQEKTGIDIDKGSLSPQELHALQQYEMDHEEELLRIKQEDNRIAADLEKAYLADVQSARNMQQTAIESDDKFVRRFVYYFAIFWAICTASYIGFITFGVVPEDNVRFADTILGFLLGTILSGIFNFFYGSSKGSQDKTQAMLKEISK